MLSCFGLILCDPVNRSPPGSSVHEILQARILEWVAVTLLQGIFPTQGSNLCVLHLLHQQAGFFPTSATWEQRCTERKRGGKPVIKMK